MLFDFYLIIVGCGEEFVFRGYLHRELRKAFNFKVSVILGGLAFGFAHGYSHFMIQAGVQVYSGVDQKAYTPFVVIDEAHTLPNIILSHCYFNFVLPGL